MDLNFTVIDEQEAKKHGKKSVQFCRKYNKENL